jgi:hypothetical protein
MMENKPLKSNLLNNLIGKEVEFYISYPNYIILNKDGDRCVLIHHGHYQESLYYLVSKLKVLLFKESNRPDSIEMIEEENFAWIDFL